WCVYPNFDEIPEYTGYLKPKNFEIFRDFLNANGMGNLSHQYLLASGKLQTLCYKEDIESALRTPGMGGFELLDLHDFPGQGTALVGVLDPFWHDKGYVTAKEYSRFCNRTVPLARLPKRVFTTDETLTGRLELAHFGPGPIEGAVTHWRFMNDKQVLAEGKLPAKDIPVGNGISLGDVAIDLKNVPAPAHCKLVVSVADAENDWDIWVYPTNTVSPAPTGIMVTSRFDATARARLQVGWKVLLTIPAKQVRNYDTDPVKVGFSSIFWNTAWTARQAPTTLGILCDPKNPALSEFPTDFYSDWQWWYLIHRAGALRLDLLPSGAEPIVRVIDDWVTAHPLALVTEAKVGTGKMVICGFDLTEGADDPVSRQMLRSLLDYMDSPKFAPRTECTLDQIQSLQIQSHVVPAAPKASSGIAHIKADSEQEGYEVKNAIDGNPQTFWHSSWAEGSPGFPHELTIELSDAKMVAGITALPRQDGNQNGWIKDYLLYTSLDGENWGDPVARGTFTKTRRLKTVKFSAPTRAKFIKLVAESGYADGSWASLAEFNVIDANEN
ncbi:MAG TPA: discoidin domain-containing protein, partial [Verrucomicrobiae bacterium]|nr:discoidin domain-containing protein [Verrucomicrobiae bacterium]